jgi:D-aminopeptidase
MPKIKLGNRPKTFKHNIKVMLPEGEEGTVEMVYLYRTRTEFGKFIDELFAEAKVASTARTEDEIASSLEEALSKTRDTNADYILKVAQGWNLESEFNRENVAQLCDELPGVALAIINTYRTAISEGRVGN